MTTFKSTLTREQREDKAYQIMVSKADMLEPKLGQRTNVETIHEGRTNFHYSVMFCDENNKITTKIIKVSTRGLY